MQKNELPLDTYLKGNHPLQIEIFRIVSELLEIPSSEIKAERDDCGAPTLYLKLLEMSSYIHSAVPRMLNWNK